MIAAAFSTVVDQPIEVMQRYFLRALNTDPKTMAPSPTDAVRMPDGSFTEYYRGQEIYALDVYRLTRDGDRTKIDYRMEMYPRGENSDRSVQMELKDAAKDDHAAAFHEWVNDFMRVIGHLAEHDLELG